MDPAAIDAGMDVVKRLGPDAARGLLRILEMPDDLRWSVATTLFQQESTVPVGEIIANVEQDLTGKTRERLIVGLRAALDSFG